MAGSSTTSSSLSPSASSSASLSSDDLKMAELIESIADDPNTWGFTTFGQVQERVLKRVEDAAFGEEKEMLNKYKAAQDSVFDRVEQHKLNGESKLNAYEEQFKKVHNGKDHLKFTEEWLEKETGRKIELECVLKNPSFEDFVGTYKIWPQSAYIASKLSIDPDDFMGVYDLGNAPTDATKVNTKGTYEGISADGKDEHHHFTKDELSELKKHEEDLEKRRADINKADIDHDYDKDEASTCCNSDVKVNPHKLGEGEYLQFRLRNENVSQYLDHSYTARTLKSLITRDAESNGNKGKEPIYIFTASANGIMRFHPWGGIRRKLWHGYGDSCSTANFFKNIGHAGSYGCFCFGIIYKEKTDYIDQITGHHRQGGRTIVMRYNRWATDNQPIYAMVRKEHDDRSIPVQPPARSWFPCCSERDKFK